MLSERRECIEARRLGMCPIWFGNFRASFIENRKRKEIIIYRVVSKGFSYDQINNDPISKKRVLRELEKDGVNLTKKKGFDSSGLTIKFEVIKFLGYGVIRQKKEGR